MSVTAARAEFQPWIAGVADGIDTGAEPATALLSRLTAAGFVGAGVPVVSGGSGGTVVDGVAAIAEAAYESLAAAFVLWGHRSYIEYLLQSSNLGLAERLLPELLSGRVAGATGLSNAMKFLAGLEPLQISARTDGEVFILDGKMPWVTNLRVSGFHVAAAVDRADGGPAFVASLSHDDQGLARSEDLDLIALRSTDTAALTLSAVGIGPERIVAENAAEWLPRVRPAFAGLQCGMSIGLARRSLFEAGALAGSGRAILSDPILEARQRLNRSEAQLFAGLQSRQFEADAAPLFELRIELADIVAEAAQLELQARGGSAYLAGPGRGFARRWREAAFIPVITPSLVQLKTALARRRAAA